MIIDKTMEGFIKKSNRWLGLLAVIPALAMIFTDQAVLPVALPTIQSHLGASNIELWWCVNSYILVSTIFLLVGGKLGSLFGYRKTFASGMTIFAFASALCGFSSSILWLIFARGLQGIGAALMIPASSPLIMSLFPQKERGKANGINVSISSIFLISAPLIGGYFTEVLSWQWIFWVNLPIAALGLLLIFLFLPKSPRGVQRFDPLGFLFFLISCSSLVVMIMQSTQWGWFSIETSILFAFFSVFAFLLLWRELYAKHPLIDLSLFRHPIYKAVNISVFSIQFVIMITVYRAVFFQDVFAWSPMKSGSVFFFTSLPVLFMSPIAGWAADRFGSKIPITFGFGLLIYSFFWSAFFVQSSLTSLLLGFFAFGLGVPLVFTPSYSAAMGSIPPTKAGTAFGVLATVRSLSASLGVAIITSFAAHIELSSLQKLLQNDPSTASLNAFIIHSLSSYPSEKVAFYVKESRIEGFFLIHLGIGFLLILAFAITFLLHHRSPSHSPPSSPAEGWD